MGLGLNSRAEDGQNVGIGTGQQPGGEGGAGGGAHGGYVLAVHDGRRSARFGVEDGDNGLMAGYAQPVVVGKDADQLDGKRLGTWQVGGHHEQVALPFPDLCGDALGLGHAATAEFGHGRPKGVNERVQVQQLLYLVPVENQHGRNASCSVDERSTVAAIRVGAGC